jgi:hypothetical protein
MMTREYNWGLLNSYIGFSSEKNIQRLVRAKQKKSIKYQKEDLLKDRINSMKFAFRDLGVSFSGKSTFKSGCIVEKVELEDFSCLFVKLEKNVKEMYPKLQSYDRVELWKLVYGNFKSHLSNHRSDSSLFHSNYSASAPHPVLNYYRPSGAVKHSFIEVSPTKIILQLIDIEGKIIDQELKQKGIC